MAWYETARRAARRVGLEPRYLRRLRWIAKVRAVRGVGASVHRNARFVLTDPEPSNFTYELANESELASWIEAVCGSETSAAELLAEARDDPVLAERLDRATGRRWWWTKRAPPYGKRLAWYALARVLKPELVIETGVHDGLGSLVLLRALERNAQDGAPGRLVSFDINPAAGWIVGAHPLWELRIESTRAGLHAVLGARPPVGLFIHDSLHTYENERYELRAAAAALASNGALISDNSHVTRALADTCEEFGLRYYEFHERPLGHFYTGGAMGAGRR
jgi:hypothetical protein